MSAKDLSESERLALKASHQIGPAIKNKRRSHGAALKERFMLFVMPEPNSGCWLWTGNIDHSGYGTIWCDGKPIKAHRVSYELECGKIPTGLQIDHLCRMRCCVNPTHLEAVTAIENTRRGLLWEFAGSNNRKKTHCKHGHEFTEENTRRDNIGRRYCRVCIAVNNLKSNAKQKAELAAARAVRIAAKAIRTPGNAQEHGG